MPKTNCFLIVLKFFSNTVSTDSKSLTTKLMQIENSKMKCQNDYFEKSKMAIFIDAACSAKEISQTRRHTFF